MESAIAKTTGFQGRVDRNVAMQPRAEAFSHIVKFRPLSRGDDKLMTNEAEKGFFAAQEAEEFAILLARSGDALADDIQIYENTQTRIVVSAMTPPRPPSAR